MISSDRCSAKRNRSGQRIFQAVKSACLFGLIMIAMKPDAANAKNKNRPKVLVKFATLAPEGSSWMKTMRAIDKEVREKTSNGLGFKFYTGGVQGDEKDVLRKIRNGQLHGGGFTGYGLGSIAPEVRVLELPFLFESYDELDFVRASMDSLFFDIFDGKKMILLGWADVGFINIFSNTPIKTPQDLRAARIWTWSGDRLAELFFKAFKVSPIPLSVPDVLTSLQMGVIDAVYASPLACVAVQWFTQVKYMTDVPITHSIGAVLVSKKALGNVPQSDIEILLGISRAKLKILTQKTRVQNAEAVEEMAAEGISVVHTGDEARSSFFSTGKKAWDEGIGRFYSKQLFDKVTDLIQAYRHSALPPKSNKPGK